MKRILWAAFYIFLFSFLIYNSFSYLDPDFGWHLKFGEIIWQSRSIPHDQIFMWPLFGDTWVDHEWLANLAIFGLWSAGGYPLITLVFALLPVLTLWLINRHLIARRALQANAQFAVALLEIIAVIAMRPHFGIRVQEITVLFLAILLLCISRIRTTKKWQSALWLPPLMYVWACSHAGFLIGLTVLALWLGYEILLRYVPRLQKYIHEQPLPTPILFPLIIIGLISFGVTWLTPYGIHLYGFLNDYRNNYYMKHIQEWQSPYSFPIHYLQIAYNIVITSLTAGLLGLRNHKLSIFNALITFLFIGLAFKSVRHFPLLVVVSLIWVIPYAAAELTDQLRLPRKKTVLQIIIIACLGALTIACLANARYTTKPFASYCQNYPCAAIDFLKAHPEYAQGRIFNHYNFGGFTIGLWPELRLFIDGRLPQYPFNDTTILEEYNKFNNSDQDADDMLTKYGITTVWYRKPLAAPHVNIFEYYILGYRKKQFLDTSSPLLNHLSNNPNWEKVYQDNQSVIYVRK